MLNPVTRTWFGEYIQFRSRRSFRAARPTIKAEPLIFRVFARGGQEAANDDFDQTRWRDRNDRGQDYGDGPRLEKGEIKNQEWVSPSANSTADGSLYFTILDLAKWDAALYTEKVLKEASKREMWTVAALNDGMPNWAGYGFAWVVDSRNGHRLVGHDGRWQGFTTHIARYLDDRLTIAILTNQGNCDLQRIVDEVAAIYFGKDAHAD
jgi:Beta-lactamase